MSCMRVSTPDHQQLMERLQIKANLVVPIVTGGGAVWSAGGPPLVAKPTDWQPTEVHAAAGGSRAAKCPP